MGVVPQIDNLDTELTVEQNLMMFAVLYRVPTSVSVRTPSSGPSTSPS